MRRPLINEPGDLVREALEGLELSYPHLVRVVPEHGYVTRRIPARDKVGLVSGGGAGHEPLHAGFVGTGMLDVAVSGAVFASPTALQVLEATTAADSGRGVVQIVKNYTGDVLNFRIAGEIAGDTEVATEVVLVDDDLATDGREDGPGRRGTAAVVLVEKIAGAAAERGASLPEVAALGRRVANSTRTMSIALQAGTYPGADQPQFTLDDDEVEFGVGIHGERGIARIPLPPAGRLVDELTRSLLGPLRDATGLVRGDDAVLVVNGLGGTSPLELQVLARAAHHQLADAGVTVARSLVGSYVTSLDMHGFSLTLMPADGDLLMLWDAPVRTPALTW